MNQKLPEGFKSWNHLYNIITEMFDGELITNDFRICLGNLSPKNLAEKSSEQLQIESDFVATWGDVKANAFDELAENRLQYPEALFLFQHVREQAYQQKINPEISVNLIDKLKRIVKLTRYE